MHSVCWDADTFLDGALFLYQALLKARSTAHFITFSPARAHKHACTQTPVQARAHGKNVKCVNLRVYSAASVTSSEPSHTFPVCIHSPSRRDMKSTPDIKHSI